MSLHLHLGAHKTASTHLQASLRRDRAALTQDGLRLIAPDEARAARGGRFTPLAVAAARLRRISEGPGLTLASDENSLGGCAEIIASGALYPRARRRLSVWRRAGAGGLHVFLSVRDYAGFFAGVHAQAARGGAAAPLAPDRRAGLAALPRRWPDLAADIRAALPEARLTLWRFEDHEALSAQILKRMTGGRDVAPVARRPMATPSAEAMAAIFDAAASRAARRSPIEEYDAFRKAGAGGAPYDPFTADERAAMSAAYAEDLSQLQADRSIEFLIP